MDRFLDIVDSVNVLARLEALAGMLWFRRQGHEIRVNRIGQLSGVDCARILRARGVRVWGGRATGSWFVMYVVSAQQAVWAESILLSAGCELKTISPGAKAFNKLPVPWQGRQRDG